MNTKLQFKKKAVIAAGLGIALAFGAAAAPAFALGGPTTKNGIVGKSFISGDNTDAFTYSNVGKITLSVQLTSGGTLVAGTKVTTTSGSPAEFSTVESYYLPGGHHVGGSTVFNT